MKIDFNSLKQSILRNLWLFIVFWILDFMFKHKPKPKPILKAILWFSVLVLRKIPFLIHFIFAFLAEIMFSEITCIFQLKSPFLLITWISARPRTYTLEYLARYSFRFTSFSYFLKNISNCKFLRNFGLVFGFEPIHFHDYISILKSILWFSILVFGTISLLIHIILTFLADIMFS